jgi:hypothetical protein
MKIAHPSGGSGGMSHAGQCEVLPGQSQAICQQLSHSAVEVAAFSCLSCMPIRDAAGRHPFNQHGKDLSPYGV